MGVAQAMHRLESGLDLFVVRISDGRRLVILREHIQLPQGTTQEQTAESTTQSEPRSIFAV